MSDTQKDNVSAGTQDINESFNLLGDFKNVSSPGVQDDNAHTERYFANEQKNMDYSGGVAAPAELDPQAFVQRMSASAKETQEQLDAMFSETAGSAANNQKKLVESFMESERAAYAVLAPKPAPPAPIVPAAAAGGAPAEPIKTTTTTTTTNNNEKVPLAPFKPVVRPLNDDDDYDYEGVDDNVDEEEDDGDEEEDDYKCDTEGSSVPASGSVSCNASPAKKPTTVADQLKEQDNEKFISSEDLLTDFNDEVVPKASSPSSSSQSTLATKPKHDIVVEKPTPPPITTTTTTTATPIPMPVAAATASTSASTPLGSDTAPLPPKRAAAAAAAAAVAAPPAPGFTSVEEIFCKFGLVESLIYWRDLKKSGIVFGVGLVTLLAISFFSVISVVAYLALTTLVGAIAYRIYMGVKQALQKTSEGHPFKEYLDFDLTISEERVHKFSSVAVAVFNGFIVELRRLFLVEDVLDSLKFGVLLYTLTYIGAWFNGMTLVILIFVSLFTLPKVYENNQQLIDAQLLLVRNKLVEIGDKVKAALPIGNKKPIAAAKTEKDE